MSSPKRPDRRLRRFVRRTVTLALVLLIGVPATLVLALRFIDPPTSAFMFAQQWRGWRAGHERPWVQQSWLSWEQLPGRVALALVASEDQRFPHHNGFDWVEVRAALETRSRGGRLRGASTITQQTAKNLFLWPGRSWVRKAVEAGMTGLLELIWSKRRILEVYANIAQFGPRTFGVDAAARRHFGIAPHALSVEQASLLAAMLPAPNRFQPSRPGSELRRRAARVRDAMRRLGARHLDALGVVARPIS